VRIRTIPVAVATAALFSSVVLAVVPAAADTSTPIGVDNVIDTVVDGAHQHLYISGGSVISVVDYTGKVVTRLTGLSGVSDLQLSPDGSTLYAAVTGADKIVAFDTGTFTQTAEYPTGDGTAPRRIALTEGRIWFGYGDQWESGLGEVDLTADPAAVTLDLAGDHDFAGAPMLYAAPANPDTLAAVQGDPDRQPEGDEDRDAAGSYTSAADEVHAEAPGQPDGPDGRRRDGPGDQRPVQGGPEGVALTGPLSSTSAPPIARRGFGPLPSSPGRFPSV
jgi:hypothetical protein